MQASQTAFLRLSSCWHFVVLLRTPSSNEDPANHVSSNIENKTNTASWLLITCLTNQRRPKMRLPDAKALDKMAFTKYPLPPDLTPSSSLRAGTWQWSSVIYKCPESKNSMCLICEDPGNRKAAFISSSFLNNNVQQLTNREVHWRLWPAQLSGCLSSSWPGPGSPNMFSNSSYVESENCKSTHALSTGFVIEYLMTNQTQWWLMRTAHHMPDSSKQ